VDVIVFEAQEEGEVEGSHQGRQHAGLDGGTDQLCDPSVRHFTPHVLSAGRVQLWAGRFRMGNKFCQNKGVRTK
jgi:hypothetical protein